MRKTSTLLMTLAFMLFAPSAFAHERFVCDRGAGVQNVEFELSIQDGKFHWAYNFNGDFEMDGPFSDRATAVAAMGVTCKRGFDGVLKPVQKFSGEYEFHHKISMAGYTDQKSCDADKGEWSDRGCLFQVADTVSVKQDAQNGAYSVEISTLASNAHLCSFEADAVVMNKNMLLATAIVDVYDNDSDKVSKEVCAVGIEYLDYDTVSVQTNGKCRQYYCGARAGLEIDRAERRK